jgi:hypothetical protein
MLAVKASMVHLQCIILSEICCSKNAEAAENCHIFQLESIFQRSVTHSIVACAAHQAITSKAGVCMAAISSY